MQLSKERLARAKTLLRTIHHTAIATVNDDGTPHSSPVFMAFDPILNGYWSSHPENTHSRNITRDGHVFLVVFDSREGHGGLYIQAIAEEVEDDNQHKHAYALLKQLKGDVHGAMSEREQYMGDGQRLYVARPVKLWLNSSDKDASGAIVRDHRYEITIDALRLGDLSS